MSSSDSFSVVVASVVYAFFLWLAGQLALALPPDITMKTYYMRVSESPPVAGPFEQRSSGCTCQTGGRSAPSSGGGVDCRVMAPSRSQPRHTFGVADGAGLRIPAAGQCLLILRSLTRAQRHVRSRDLAFSLASTRSVIAFFSFPKTLQSKR